MLLPHTNFDLDERTHSAHHDLLIAMRNDALLPTVGLSSLAGQAGTRLQQRERDVRAALATVMLREHNAPSTPA